MSKPLPKHLKCINCLYYSPLGESMGMCMRDPHRTTFVLPEWQIEFCFERIKT